MNPADVKGVRATTPRYVSSYLVRQIAELKHVERLEIDASLLKSSEMPELARIASLRELILFNLHVDAATIEQLAAIRSLKRLEVRSGSTEHGGAVVSLAKIAVLGTISLSGTSITDGELEPLTALAQLDELRLLDTHITPEAVDRLRQKLAQTNVICDDLRRHREAAEWVLNIGGAVDIVDDTSRRVSNASDFPEHPFRVVTIDLANRTEVSDDDLTRLRDLAALDKLNLEGTGISDKGLEHLRDLLKLTSLTLNRTRVTGSGLVHLARLDSLHYLSTAGAPLTSDGLSHLPPLSGLHTFNIQSTDLSDGYLAPVSRLPSLNSLGIWAGRAAPGLEHLRGMPLQTLSLRWQSDLPDESLVHLAAIPNLRELDFTGTQCLTAEGFQHLAKVRTWNRSVGAVRPLASSFVSC